MGGPKSSTSCCPSSEFRRLTEELSVSADVGSAEGVEFTVGKCVSCGALLMHSWVAGGFANGYHKISQSFVEVLTAQHDAKKRKKMLADWWNALGA